MLRDDTCKLKNTIKWAAWICWLSGATTQQCFIYYYLSKYSFTRFLACPRVQPYEQCCEVSLRIQICSSSRHFLRHLIFLAYFHYYLNFQTILWWALCVGGLSPIVEEESPAGPSWGPTKSILEHSFELLAALFVPGHGAPNAKGWNLWNACTYACVILTASMQNECRAGDRYSSVQNSCAFFVESLYYCLRNSLVAILSMFKVSIILIGSFVGFLEGAVNHWL